MKLKRVGFFFELSPVDRRRELILLRRESASDHEPQIVNYLLHGAPCAAIPELEEDVLQTPPIAIGCPHLLTDGTWTWPQTLRYYVEKYHIELPNDFIDHMRRYNWECKREALVLNPQIEGHVSMG